MDTENLRESNSESSNEDQFENISMGTLLKFLDKLLVINRFFDKVMDWLEKHWRFEKRHIDALFIVLEKTIPFLIIIAGIKCLCTAGRYNTYYLPFSVSSDLLPVFAMFLAIISSVIVPKFFSLFRSLTNFRETYPVRPEILFCLKFLLLIAFAICPIVFIFPIVLIFLVQPNLIGIKAEVPKSAVEEGIGLLVLLPNILIFFILPCVWLSVLVGLFTRGVACLISTLIMPVTILCGVYISYSIFMFVIKSVSIKCDTLSEIKQIKQSLQEPKDTTTEEI